MKVPDTRTDKDYNEKYLNEDDKKYINGFDFGAEETIDSFFANLESFDWDVEDEDIDLYRILTNHPDICDRLQENLKEHFESERDMLIVSMIDSMNDEEYDKIKEEVDAE